MQIRALLLDTIKFRNLRCRLLAIAVCVRLQISATNITHREKVKEYLIIFPSTREGPVPFQSHYTYVCFQLYLSFEKVNFFMYHCSNRLFLFSNVFQSLRITFLG